MKSSQLPRPALPGLSIPGSGRRNLFSTLRPVFYVVEAVFYFIIAGLSLRYVMDRTALFHLPLALSFLRYASILTCFSYALTASGQTVSVEDGSRENVFGKDRSGTVVSEKEAKLPLLQALFFTVFADYFLVFTTYYLPGILFFILVQNTYRRFLSAPFVHWFCSGAAAMGLLLLASQIFSLSFDSVSAFSAFYGGCLLANLVFSIQKGPGWFSLSLTLLLLCDFHVALGHLFRYLPGPYPGWLAGWVGMTPFLIWSFYLPAQIILAAHADAQLR